MMDMREKLIDKMMEHLPHPTDGEYELAADAIIEAMPDMIVPMKFNKIGAEWICYSHIGPYLVAPYDGGYGWWGPYTDTDYEPDGIQFDEGKALSVAQCDYRSSLCRALGLFGVTP